MKVSRNCEVCGAHYERNVSQERYRAGLPRYCSPKCSIQARVGHFYPPADVGLWKKRIGEASKKRTCSQEHMEKLWAGARKPHPWTSERNRQNKGSKCPSWKGGKSSDNALFRASEEFLAWRRTVFTRDKFSCGFCGVSSGKMEADHIRPFCLYPELRLEVANGQTLCKPCHKRKTALDRIWYDNFRTRL